MLRRRAIRADRELLDYNNQCGYQPLREMIAHYLLTSRGVRCRSSQIIVVASTRTAISLACFVLTKRGDTAVLGLPGYYRAQTSFQIAGLNPVQVPVDAKGLCVDELTRRAPDARVVHVTPCHDWPTGVPLSSERREDLLTWAQRQNAWILEDDYDSEFHFDGPPLKPLKAEVGSDRVIFLGSFSKTLAPSIRCAYLVVPENLEERFLECAVGIGAEPSLHLQGALADLIKEGCFTQHIQRMRKAYRARRDELQRALTQTLGDVVAVRPSAGGLQLIADLPPHVCAEAASRRAAEQDLYIRPMSAYYFGRPAPNGFHLGFAPVPEHEIAPAVQRLAGVLEPLLMNRY
jgi:GntR family transcriptional regulator/MocR family aminotransferase